MAGNESVAANYSDMQSTATQFNNQVASFEQALSQISSAVSNLQSTWVGQGATSFSTVMTQWNTDVTKLNQLLSEISAAVNKGAGTYGDTDSSVASGFSSLGG